MLAVAPLVGSYLGLLIQRLPDAKPTVWARSACDACGARLAARDLIPFASWLAARGRCRYCGRWLGWFYPAVEAAALLVALSAFAIDDLPRAVLDCVLGWWLLVLGWIDLRHWLLPDILTLPLIAAGLVAAALWATDRVFDQTLGAICGYLAFRVIAWVYRGLRQREGLGRGDAKLLAASGAWVGVAALPQVVSLAALASLCAAAVLGISGMRLRLHTALPFGPFLALATWAIWLLGPIPI